MLNSHDCRTLNLILGKLLKNLALTSTLAAIPLGILLLRIY